jgi:NAD(P)-dependent dehydrogenase (short-subunit alcohol dehydrogenase family)
MSGLLSTKVAIVTGAAGGLGKAIAKALLNAGATVIINDVNAGMLGEAKTELSSLGKVHDFVADLTDADATWKLVDEAREKFGKLDILINNAGVMDIFAPIGDVDLDFFDRVISTDLIIAARMSKFAVQDFLREGRPGPQGGVILNVGSINGLRGGIAGVAYTTAKHGLVGLTRSTAAHYATKGIRTNIIMPGLMDTNVRTAYVNGVHEKGKELAFSVVDLNPGKVDIDRLGKFVAFICSDDADYLNGAIISADCGWQAI